MYHSYYQASVTHDGITTSVKHNDHSECVQLVLQEISKLTTPIQRAARIYRVAAFLFVISVLVSFGGISMMVGRAVSYLALWMFVECVSSFDATDRKSYLQRYWSNKALLNKWIVELERLQAYESSYNSPSPT